MSLSCLSVESDVDKWTHFIQNLQDQYKGEIPPPFAPVETLALKYLKKPGRILDIGCETGKNSACLIRHGHTVILLDIAPNAIQYTTENLQRESLGHGIENSLVAKIEDLPPQFGPFQAVVGTYAFSFIPPDLFENTMKYNVLNGVEHGGYFVGGFFGKQHAWAANPALTILTVEELESLFSSLGFSLLEVSEEIKETRTVLNGIQKFHTIHVIAHRTLMMDIS